MSDVSNKVTRLNGVNTDTNNVQHDAYVIDTNALGITSAGSYTVAVIPAGNVVRGGTMVALSSITPGGTVVIQAKPVSGAAVILHSQASAAVISAGYAKSFVNSGGVCYVDGQPTNIDVVVGTSAITSGGKLFLDIESVPVGKYLTNG